MRAALAAMAAFVAGAPTARAGAAEGPMVPFVIAGGLGPSGLRRAEGLGSSYAYGGAGGVHLGYDVTSALTPWVGVDGARWEAKDGSRGLWEVSAMGGLRYSFIAGVTRPWLEAGVGYSRLKNDTTNNQTGLRLQAAVGSDWAAGAFGRIGFYLEVDHTSPSEVGDFPYTWAGAGVSFALHARDLH